jgi:hypothetical protein
MASSISERVNHLVKEKAGRQHLARFVEMCLYA